MISSSISGVLLQTTNQPLLPAATLTLPCLTRHESHDRDGGYGYDKRATQQRAAREQAESESDERQFAAHESYWHCLSEETPPRISLRDVKVELSPTLLGGGTARAGGMQAWSY
jgi:hypothetical protein